MQCIAKRTGPVAAFVLVAQLAFVVRAQAPENRRPDSPGPQTGPIATAAISLERSLVDSISPAAQAGIIAGDVLTRIDNTPVRDIDDVQLAVSTLPPGATATLSYDRDGKPATVQVTLAKRAIAGKKIVTVQPSAWQGMRVDYSTALEGQSLLTAANSGAIDPQGCVVVTDVAPQSLAWKAGARPGMFVSHVAGQRVATPGEFYSAVNKLGDKFDLQFTTPLAPETPVKSEPPKR